MNATAERFASVLRQLREERGWSQEQLAAQAGLNRSYLGEVERGNAMPTLTTVAKLASALEIRLSSLIERCEHK